MEDMSTITTKNDGYELNSGDRNRTISQSSIRLNDVESSNINSSYTYTYTNRNSPNPSTPEQNTVSLDEGYLGVSNHSTYGGGGGGGGGGRSSRMIGKSPPPPPGPPPSDPPPLPPGPSSSSATSSTSAHPFASTRPRPSARLSSLSSVRKASLIPSRPSSPAGPPPTSQLPPIPTHSHSTKSPPNEIHTASNSDARPKHGRQSSSSSRSVIGNPPSTPPSVSPRSSSLFNTNANSQAGPSGTSTSTSTSTSNSAEGLGTPIALNRKLQENENDRSQISTAPGNASKPPRTPSRHLLQTALDLAQKAVEMDKNNDVLGALAAYREAVNRLKSVMERVGVESTSDKKGGRKGKSEEEGRTLRGIHDAYVARIQLLSSYETNDEIGTGPSSEAGPSDYGSSSRTQHPHPSVSTTTLTPADEATPRPSLDDGGMTGIGNLMLSDNGDQSFDTSGSIPSPAESQAAAISQQIAHSNHADRLISPPSIDATLYLGGPSPTLPTINHSTKEDLSLQQALDQAANASASSSTPLRGSIPNLGLGYPTSPPNMVQHTPANTSTPMPIKSHVSTRSISETDTGGSPSPSKSRLKRPNRPSMGLDMEADLTGIDGVDDGVEMLARTPRESHIPSGSFRNERRSSTASQGVIPPSPRSIHSNSNDERDRPLPPLPHSAPMIDPMTGLPIMNDRKTNLIGVSKPLPTPAPTGALLVSPTTDQGTISQRRQSRPLSGTLSALMNHDQQSQASTQFPTQPQFSVSSSNSSIRSISQTSVSTRVRAKSQPGQRPINDNGPIIPPIPSGQIRHKASFSSSSQLGIGIIPQIPRQSSTTSPGNLRIDTAHNNGKEHGQGKLAPPLNITARSGSPRSLPPLPDTAISGSLMSPMPELQPSEVIHRPFHLLRVLHSSMDPESAGSYMTGTIHVPSAVWNPSNWSKTSKSQLTPPKIIAQEIKVKCMESLILHLESIRITGQSFFNGPKTKKRVNGGGIEGNKIAEEFCLSLDELDEEMDITCKLLSKNGVLSNNSNSNFASWKSGNNNGNIHNSGKSKSLKGSSWSSRISRSVDKMTSSSRNSNNDKLNSDSTDKYVDLLSNLCMGVQVINDHLLNFTSGECTPAYAALPEKPYRNIESRLRRTADFVGMIIVPFVLDDFKQFFLRYLKGGVKYLED
ncbi:uncharacterized protein IL334_005949 [Kwoniella shivajii]|uniref:MIT domain-containing protein n=1 Tax=Kwoniella shivajii TaxID=564305 RepID=A0ABZ1D8J2_9TREE|nr:hypothetical protein IL334_005949 [Kwoniella shivajii]